MTKEAKAMMNMAMAIATINGVEIERMDLQKCHPTADGQFDHYILSVWYSDEKEIRIRQDCTIVER